MTHLRIAPLADPQLFDECKILYYVYDRRLHKRFLNYRPRTNFDLSRLKNGTRIEYELQSRADLELKLLFP